MPLTVGDVISQVRGILQDNDGERWEDPDVYRTLNLGMWEARRLRPDLFRGLLDTMPQFTSADAGSIIQLEVQYVPALVMYVAGMLQAFDIEGVEDARASAMLTQFTAKLLTPTA